MKPISQFLAGLLSTCCLTACGGISTNSESSQQATETTQTNEQVSQTQEQPVDQVEPSTTVEQILVEETIVEVNDDSEELPVTSSLDYEKAISVVKAASSIAKQGLVSNEVSTTHSLASFKTGQQVETQNNGKINVADFLSTIVPLSTDVTETMSSVTLTGECGGAAMTDGSRSYDDEVGFPYVIRANIIFDEYCTDINSVYTGTTAYDLDGHSIVFNGDGSLVSEFPNEQEGHYEFDLIFSMQTEASFLPPVVNINQWVSCSYYDGAENFNPALDCSTTLAYQGETESFVSNEFNVQGNNEIGYTVEVSLSDSANEIYQARFSNLTVCENGNFGTGSSSLSYDETEIDISFDNCSQATVDYNGTRFEVQF